MTWFRFPRVLGIVVCVYLVGLAVVFSMFALQSSRFVHDAGSTEGTVVALVAKEPVGSNRSSPANTRTVSLAPRVSYVVSGRTYEYTASRTRLHRQLKVGDKVQVQYDPVDPARARIKGEGRVIIPGIAVGFALAALLIVVVLVRTRELGGPGGSSGKTAKRDATALDEVHQTIAR